LSDGFGRERGVRSVYSKLLVWAIATVVVSGLVFGVVSRWFASREGGAGSFVYRMQKFEADVAADAYRSGGVAALEAYRIKLERDMGGRRYFTDAEGKDLLTGVTHREATGGVEPGGPAGLDDGGALVQEASDGSLRMISRIPPPFPISNFLPYFGIVVLAIALMCWPLAANLAKPLRTLSQRVDRFGQGDLTVRMGTDRRDEIGELARSFDRMAERITTLLTAERRLLQDVSHELRSPLARLSFAVELGRTEADRDAAAGRVRREIDRLSSLVGTLLDMTRAEGDPGAWERRPVLLEGLVRRIVDDCGVEASAKGTEVRFQGAPVEVAGDAELLRRAIENVIRNAVHYAGRQGRVEVAMEREEGSVRVVVRDYGPGVQEEALTRIFHPFFRIDDARSDATGGTGLGLAIAQRAVTVHQGTIFAENAGPGLRVVLVLPTV
jgi:two-component system sensor histidine kinase CpxA